MLRTTIAAAVLIFPLAAVAAPQDGGTPAEQLHRLFEAHDQWERQVFPEEAMERGDYRYADRVTDRSLAAIERRHEQRRRFLARLEAIDRDGLGEQDRVSADIFELALRRDVDGHRFRTFLAPLGTRFGPHQSIPQMADGVRFDTAVDYRNYIARLQAMPLQIGNLVERMRLGIEEGRVPPKIVMEGVPEQIEALLEPDGLAPLAKPFDDVPDAIDPEERERLVGRFRDDVLPALRTALGDLATFLRETYLPACRDSIAARDWPDGEAYYDHQLRVMTTTEMTAVEIHELGLLEVRRIRGEMMDVIARSDFLEHRPAARDLDDDARFAAFLDYLRNDPRFYHDSAEDLLAGYRAICKEIDGHLPRFFGLLPRQPYGVKPIPAFMAPRQTTAYYEGGDLRNRQPGWFAANTYALDQRPKYEMTSLALHEAVPGHHLQIAIAKELEGLPEFRRNGWFTAFGEGWALYAERLGIEMGLYEDPYDDFGRLLYEMWRACRLVVDPGMHAMGWSRQRAIDFMKANTALSELNIVNEVDRYIAWPGQATAYKIGELTIRRLRADAEKRLGARFDLAAFHDVVLGAGAIPLDVLERRVERWIRGQELGGLLYD